MRSHQDNASAPLLDRGDSENAAPGRDELDARSLKPDLNPWRVLPISLLASLGIAATVASTIYAYADLLCADPTSCKDAEQSKYAAVVAVANGITHTVAILILGPLERLVKRRLKAGLVIWLACRAASVLCVIVGVASRNLLIALSGRIFEGLASDNLLHFNLNTIYVSAHSRTTQETSQLIGSSLGLYMVGMTIAPIAVAVFTNHAASFISAIAIFAVALVYLLIGIPATTANEIKHGRYKISDDDIHHPEPQMPSQSGLVVVFSPLRLFYERYSALPHGLSLMLYTTVQAHLFPMIMVFASIRFRFDGFHNGLLVSIAAACAALQMLTILYIVPMIPVLFRRQGDPDTGRSYRPRGAVNDYQAVIAAILAQMAAIIAMSCVSSPPQLYIAVACASTGLLVPSFLKSHFVSLMSDAPRAISALAWMESVGGLLSPFLLGAWQAAFPGQSVFLFAAALLGVSLALFVFGALVA